MLSFESLFSRATGGAEPFPYQMRFAEAAELPELVHAPTGAGKTATVVLGWIWRLLYAKKPTPRRLIYCLPMRVLVEQTRDEAHKWLENLGLTEKVDTHVLMGGEGVKEWDLEPEKPAVLIGTQDMLLSRALNRGYGMSRFRWPMHFGLLNNDSLWVLDEIQLMGTGLATSTQLQAFRESLGAFGIVKTVWMSATLLPGWLGSIDYRDRVEPELRLRKLTLEPESDYAAPGLRERWHAKKPVEPAALAGPSLPAGHGGNALSADDISSVAKLVVQAHQSGSLTLAIVNTVDRSRTLFEAIRRLYAPPRPKGRRKQTAGGEPAPAPDLRLIHSQFRPKERETWRSWLMQDSASLLKDNPHGRIIISTQVVEAGVDLSARTLITELAPWPSLVQRFGRCNRRGEFGADNAARVFWVDMPTTDEKKAAPYSKDELDAARRRISSLSDVGLHTLATFFDCLTETERGQLFPFNPAHVVRKKDFVELFDTTPDLAGNDIDVSRFIRDGEDVDVQVFWRKGPPPKGKLPAAEARRLAPRREELCPVKLGKEGGIKGFLEKHTAHRWDYLASEWVAVNADDVYPGQVYWIATAEGGYDQQLGWNPIAEWPAGLWLHDPDTELEPETTEEPGYDTDLLSVYGWQSIAEHTDDVINEINVIAAELGLEGFLRAVLMLAARWHDWGKSHRVFQDAIRDEADGRGKRPDERAGKRDIAKAAPKEIWRRYERPHFRHEFASALGVLALLKSGHAREPWDGLAPHLRDLALYLIAAHHGKVRLSIRSMPDEKMPDKPGSLFARGVWQDDELPGTDLGSGVTAPAVRLDLSPMTLGRANGQPSWVERMLELRGRAEFGPLRLAYLEALLRSADVRASKAADAKAKKPTGPPT